MNKVNSKYHWLMLFWNVSQKNRQIHPHEITKSTMVDSATLNNKFMTSYRNNDDTFTLINDAIQIHVECSLHHITLLNNNLHRC